VYAGPGPSSHNGAADPPFFFTQGPDYKFIHRWERVSRNGARNFLPGIEPLYLSGLPRPVRVPDLVDWFWTPEFRVVCPAVSDGDGPFFVGDIHVNGPEQRSSGAPNLCS